MTTMEIEDLINLGFNKNESIVYLSLIKFGISEASAIIKDTKFHKNIVYDNLEKLIDKGLVSYIIEEGRKVFNLASPQALIQFFDNQEKEIKEKKAVAERLSKELNNNIKKTYEKQEAEIYRGVRGIKTFFNETLNSDGFVAFGGPPESVSILGEDFWINYQLKRTKKKVKVKLLFNQSIRKFGDNLRNRLTEIRYFEQDFEPLTETHIEEEKVALIVWTKEPFLFLIRDKNVAKSYMKFFENVWKSAKK